MRVWLNGVYEDERFHLAASEIGGLPELYNMAPGEVQYHEYSSKNSNVITCLNLYSPSKCESELWSS